MTQKVSGNLLLDSKLIFKEAEIGDGMKVADLGCGSHGYFVFPVAEIVGKSGLVYAVDILKNALENVRRRAKLENKNNIKIVWSNLENFGVTRIETNSLDSALLINTLHQTTKRAEVLREAIRMLKKKGRLVIVEWKDMPLPFGPNSKDRVKNDLLKNAADKLGLELDKDFSVGPYHYGLIFKKL